jgi:UDP-N-acetyl-D-glucosamine dehydrogenase
MNVAVIGQGYVGLPLAISAASAGHYVTGVDLNPALVAKLNSGISPIGDVTNQELKQVLESHHYKSVTRIEDGGSFEVFVICVPTPLTYDNQPDLSFVKAAAESIERVMINTNLIILESTVAPGTTRSFVSGLLGKSGKLFDLAYSPERIDPSNENWKISNTPKLVAGLTEPAMLRAVDFYSSFIDNVISCSNVEVVETAKLLENSFRLVNISFINEVAEYCDKIGIDVKEVVKAASTKPYGFMPFYPGAGIGGHCIPVDPIYLASAAKGVGVETKLIDLANEINKSRAKYFLHRANNIVGSLQDKRILVIGVAYKPNVSDTRETPAFNLIHLLREAGARVEWHDDLVKTWEGESSSSISDKFDLAILVNPHSNTDLSSLNQVKVLDTRGNS